MVIMGLSGTKKSQDANRANHGRVPTSCNVSDCEWTVVPPSLQSSSYGCISQMRLWCWINFNYITHYNLSTRGIFIARTGLQSIKVARWKQWPLVIIYQHISQESVFLKTYNSHVPPKDSPQNNNLECWLMLHVRLQCFRIWSSASCDLSAIKFC